MRKDVVNGFAVAALLFVLSCSTVNGQIEVPICETPYQDLDRQVFLYSDSAAIYRLDGLLFSGCAFEHHTKENVVFYYEIRNGWVERELGITNTGQISREFNFKDGKSHGVHRMLHDDGSKYIEEFYEKGKPHGYSKRWHSNGQMAREALFENGKLIYERTFDSDGTQIK